MIRIRQIKIDIDSNIDVLKEKCLKILKININDIKDIKINKRSIDARFKPKLYYIYEVDVKVNNEENVLKKIKDKDVFKIGDENYKFLVPNSINKNNKIIVVGLGPAGLFCSYMLAKFGFNVITIERGEKIEDRVKTVEDFFKNGILNTESNVQFGEGGAGTFSDGKLNTLIKDKSGRIKFVLETFVECGAPKEILYDSKPHIGTDILRCVIINMRNKIIDMGGTILYNTCLTDIIINNNTIKEIEVNHKEIIKCDSLVLALGHSARDTFELLLKRGVNMEAKPFAVGVRVMHNQSMINERQYGRLDLNAPYKLTYKSSNNRGVYSFCMCPGGYVVNASSEKNMLAINGMSNYKRDSGIANSAIIVTVNKDDFGSNPLDGVKFQKELEKKAYKYGNGNIPIQLFKDFKDNKVSSDLKSIKPEFKGSTSFANINDILPSYICDSLKEGIEYFDTKINGFAQDDTVIAAVESRTSSPVRINRNDSFESNIKGIYPIGEGAGYAGGIMSAAVDGIKAFEKIIENTNSNF